jgi:hypothetical protein
MGYKLELAVEPIYGSREGLYVLDIVFCARTHNPLLKEDRHNNPIQQQLSTSSEDMTR